MTSAPHVLPHDDGAHFWWIHDCWDYLGERGARREGEQQVLLPVGPNGWSYDTATDTVSPSLLCGRCGTHGFWENGQWRAC